MNLLDEHGDDLDAGMVLVHVGSERVAQRPGHILAASTEHRIELARIEVAQYQPTRGLPDEGFGVRNRIDGLHGSGVGEAHTIQYADLGAHTLKALLAGPAAGNQVVCLARMRALPQTVQRSRRRGLRPHALLHLLRRGGIDADGHRVDGSVLDRAQAPERPGQQQVQPGTEHRDRRAEAFVDAALPEVDQLQARQNPAQQRRPQHGRQNGRAQKLESPAARKVQSEVSLQQRAGRARTACNDGGKQAFGDRRRVRRRRRGKKHPRQRAYGQL